MRHTQKLIETNFRAGDRVRLSVARILGKGLIKHFASYGFVMNEVYTIIDVEELCQNGVFVKGACSQSIKLSETFDCNASFLEHV